MTTPAIVRLFDILSQLLDCNDMENWLNTPHPDLDWRTPLHTVIIGRADAVLTLLENSLEGLPL